MSQKNGKKYYQLIANTLLFALGNIGSKLLVFFLMPLYTNELTTAQYGISELVITGTNLLIPFVSVSIQDATLRFALDKNNKSGEVLKNTIFILFIGSIVTCLLYPVIGLYSAVSDWTGYFVAITVVYMIRNALSIYLKSIGKTKLYAIDSVLYTLYLMTTNILFLSVFKIGLEGYFLAIVLSSLLSIIELILFGNAIWECKNNRINKQLLCQMIKFSVPMIFNNVSWWIINSSDKVMIEYFQSVSEAGIYSVAAKIPSIIITLTNIFNQAWIISSVTEYDNDRDTIFFSRIFTVFNCLLVVASSFIVLIIKPFMSIYVGSSFVECWVYVPFLLLGSIFQSYATFFGAIYTSAKKNVSVMTTTMIAAAMNIFLNIILIPKIGIQGAVVATAVSYLAVFVFRIFDSQKYIRFTIDYPIVMTSVILLSTQCYVAINFSNSHAVIISYLLFAFILIVNRKVIYQLASLMKNKICRQKI